MVHQDLSHQPGSHTEKVGPVSPFRRIVADEPNIGFITIAVVFVSATMLGFASHAPGGLGVFDAAMLVALWQFDTEDLVAGLLLFRLLYYLVPFAISLAILGGRELWFSFLASRQAGGGPPGQSS